MVEDQNANNQHEPSDEPAHALPTGGSATVEGASPVASDSAIMSLDEEHLPAKGPFWARNLTVRTAAIVVGSAVLVGIVAGTAVGYAARPDVATTSEFKTMKHHLSQDLDATKTQLGITTNDLDAANQHLADIKDREAALSEGEAKLKVDQAALDKQTQQVQSTQFGDGIHVVGSTVTPGVYSITTSVSCYYAWMSGTGADAAIIDNNIVSGPAVVTLKAGDVFESSRCGTWTKTG